MDERYELPSGLTDNPNLQNAVRNLTKGVTADAYQRANRSTARDSKYEAFYREHDSFLREWESHIDEFENFSNAITPEGEQFLNKLSYGVQKMKSEYENISAAGELVDRCNAMQTRIRKLQNIIEKAKDEHHHERNSQGAIDRGLLAKAEAGDVDALYAVGIEYHKIKDFANSEKYWEMCVDKGGDGAAYNLLCLQYGAWDMAPDKVKFLKMLKKMVDKFQGGWSKIMLGGLYCGAMRSGFAYAFGIEPTDGSFLIMDGIELDPRKGMSLLEDGLQLVERNNFSLKSDDYDVIANAYNNRFNYFIKKNITQEEFYPPGYEPLNDLRQYIKYTIKARDTLPQNHLHYDSLIELKNEQIASTEKQIAAYEDAYEAKPKPDYVKQVKEFCTACGSPFTRGVDMFCTNCGKRHEQSPAKQVKRFCTTCGTPFTRGVAMFCINCGKRLD